MINISISRLWDPSSIPGSGRSAGERIGYPLQYSWASLVPQLVKNLPAMQETWVLCLGWEDPLEESMATHSSILAWRIPWTEEPGGLQSVGSQRGTTERLNTAQHSSQVWEIGRLVACNIGINTQLNQNHMCSNSGDHVSCEWGWKWENDDKF